MESPANQVTRRAFAGASAFTIIARPLLGGLQHVPPSEKVNLALIGVGGRGAHVAMLAGWWEADLEERDLDLPEHEALVGQWDEKKKYERRTTESPVNFVAICDVDSESAARSLSSENKVYPPGDRFRKARFFTDYRVMLDQVRSQIDGVLVAVPDHSHFHATMTAMQMGLHVYTEKPLTRYVAHARRLAIAARQYKVATQMGNQGHSSWSTARVRDWILADAIGPVREVIAWNAGNLSAGSPPAQDPIPKSLEYDLWLNREPVRPYHAGQWREWSYWGTGTLGDFGCHTLDAAFYALDLEAPVRVEAGTGGGWPVKASYPKEQTITWYVPARGARPPVRVRYYFLEAGELNKRVAPLLHHLPPGASLGELFRYGRGAAIIGEKATIMYGGWGGQSRIFPDTRAKEIGFAPEASPRIDAHMRSWLRACKGQGTPLSHFEYSGPLTEMVLLGDVALRSKNGSIDWDAKNLRVAE